jgi:RecA-family ATPase
MKLALAAPNGSRAEIEILGDGQQFIVDGIHPDTKTAYRWHGGEPWTIRADELPYVSEDTARQFLHDAEKLLSEQFGYAPVVAAPVNGEAKADTLLFDQLYCGGADWPQLMARVRAGVELHDTLCSLSMSAVASGMNEGAAVRMLQALMAGSTAPHDERWRSRYDDISRLVRSAVKKRGAAPGGEHVAEAGETEITFLDLATWDAEPAPPRQWAVLDRIPLRQPTLLSGEGAVGKTLLALHLCAAHALGRDWISTLPEPGPAVYFGCEDDADELHRRVADIATHFGATFADLKAGGLHLASFAGRCALLGAANRAGVIEPTPLFHRLHKAARDIQPKTLVIDTSADVFAGNENDRMQVRQFVGLLRRLAMDGNCAVLLCSHPSLTGISTGTGLSGSTGWHNSVRARIFFKPATTDKGEEPDPELRELQFMKNNYGPIATRVLVRWRNGVFVPEPGQGAIEKAAADRKADDLFLTLLDRFNSQGRSVSDRPGRTYAPSVFAQEPEAKAAKVRKEALAAAMARLFSAGKLIMEPYGYASRGTFRIVARANP